jgi:hypothetical protein
VRGLVLSVIAGTLFSVAVANAAQERDNFEKGEDEHDTYQKALRQILWQGWRRDVVLRMIVLTPFSEEYVVGVRRVGREYRCFVINPSSHIWTEEVKRLSRKTPDFSHIRGKFEEMPVREDIVVRVARLWRQGINDPKSYLSQAERDRIISVDSTILYFLVHLLPTERAAAHTNDSQGRNATAMLRVGFDLPLYAHGDISERAFQKTLARAEESLGIKPGHGPSK